MNREWKKLRKQGSQSLAVNEIETRECCVCVGLCVCATVCVCGGGAVRVCVAVYLKMNMT